MKIAFIVSHVKGLSPGQRFRLELYESVLKEKGIKFEYYNFFNEQDYGKIYKKNLYFYKTKSIIQGFFRRIFQLYKLPKYDVIFIFREASPIGPPIFEWIYTHLLKKTVIYDFDDAIWIPTSNNYLTRLLKCFWKVKAICTWVDTVSCGNQYLCNYALRFNKQVILNPTCVDTENRHCYTPKIQENTPLIIGWTGSHSTLPYLRPIIPVLERLAQQYQFEFRVICSTPPTFECPNLHFVTWQEQSEIEDLSDIDIGLMPLSNDAWASGKCGFKIIQYLAIGIPTVASPVGINSEIVENDINGYLCETEEEWYFALEKLLNNTMLRKQMGEVGRAKIEKKFSVKSNELVFLGLFEK
jgi:glycosyltransferase involved in cell wall biosynthesis